MRAVWFSSTATSWPPTSFKLSRLTHRRATIFPVAAALSANRVPASVQNPISHFSQRSDCSMSSSCLSMSVNSIARRRNWRATAARRCSSSARRSSRPMLCASVCMVVTPGGLAVKLLAASTNLSSNPPRLPRVRPSVTRPDLPCVSPRTLHRVDADRAVPAPGGRRRPVGRRSSGDSGPRDGPPARWAWVRYPASGR